MIHLDAKIVPSYAYYIAIILFVAVLIVLGLALKLVWWHFLVVAGLLTILLWSEKGKPKLCHLVSAWSDDMLWQAMVSTYRQQELWQFYVNGLDDYGLCVVLECYVVEPMTQKIRFVVVQDMMADEDYRRLRALARFY